MAALPQRRSIRLKGYDYTREGAYYVTICTEDRRHWFGRVVDGVMHLSPIGEWARQCWHAIPDHMPYVDIGDFVMMPNHVHGIVIIRERLSGSVGVDHGRPEMPTIADRPEPSLPTAPRPQPRVDHDRPLPPPTPPANSERTMPIVPPGSLGHIIRSYKSAVTRNVYRDGLLPRNIRLWQRNYWERIIRDDAEWVRIADYIRDNPANWDRDRFNNP